MLYVVLDIHDDETFIRIAPDEYDHSGALIEHRCRSVIDEQVRRDVHNWLTERIEAYGDCPRDCAINILNGLRLDEDEAVQLHARIVGWDEGIGAHEAAATGHVRRVRNPIGTSQE